MAFFDPRMLLSQAQPLVTKTIEDDRNLKQYQQFMQSQASVSPDTPVGMLNNGISPYVPAPTPEEESIKSISDTISQRRDFGGKMGAYQDALQFTPTPTPEAEAGVPLPTLAERNAMSPVANSYRADFGTPQQRGEALNYAVGSDTTGLLTNAKKYMGTPYKWGGTSPNGFDCSGFTQYVARESGYNIPRSAAAQFNYFKQNGRLANDITAAKPGDMLYFASEASPSGWHTGIYIGNGMMVDAAGRKSGVKTSSIAGRTLRGVGVM
jgi:cell wall-associated NlpC family hydrolase